MTDRYSCPRCDGFLEPLSVQEVGASFIAHRCSKCDGRFFQAGDLEKVDDIIAPTLFEIRRIPSASEQQRRAYCPVCPEKVIMTKAEHRRDSKVIIDICPSCKGTWLDKGELDAIQTEGLLTFLANTVRWLSSLRDES